MMPTFKNFFPLVLIFAVAVSTCGGQKPPGTLASLCIPQFALANEACLEPMPTSPNIPALPRTPGERRRRSHYGGGGHGGGDVYTAEDAISPCCRWLLEIDEVCMCQALAQLPKFVSAMSHTITLRPTSDCSVTYHCPIY
ncbi:hypothetical protein H6P81_008890 [Aristolochia fimbriata]|uniref:Bifunctional inhibitor/plant lipid transfer protein/seed storage helical domain-containing protein n=1 Tax=Aristolochia fimbriata TaxID=158543 RepID=A0AAV7EJA8_ARIFI|nr:hypothetical protein H6P81_008890 [Aristolochia fimbriata]